MSASVCVGSDGGGIASHEWARASGLVGHARALARTWCTNRCWALPCSDSCLCVLHTMQLVNGKILTLYLCNSHDAITSLVI